MSTKPKLESIFSEVIPRKLYFGGFPRIDHIYRWRERLQKWGITELTIVDLTTKEEKERCRLPAYMDIYKNQDIKSDFFIHYFQYPITDNHPPSNSVDYLNFIRWLRDYFVSSSHPVIIHCRGGHGRSAMVIISLLTILYNYQITESMDRITQLHHTRPGLHHRYYYQLCPVSVVQQEFLLKLFKTGQRWFMHDFLKWSENANSASHMPSS